MPGAFYGGDVSSDDVVRFYEEEYCEADRLVTSGQGRLEFLRTQRLIERQLPRRRLRIADIGGGPGVYASWLASLGHDVDLLDPVAGHVRQALARPPQPGSLRASIGDARNVGLDDASVDAVLLLGPLYHLPEAADRAQALAEAFRIVRPGGVVFAAAISRFASFHDGLTSGWLVDPEFAAIVKADIASGHHQNPAREPGWFTEAYFHHPDELREEMAAASFRDVSVHGIEGLAGWLPDLDTRIDDPRQRDALLDGLHSVSSEPSLLGVSAHLLAWGTRPF